MPNITISYASSSYSSDDKDLEDKDLADASAVEYVSSDVALQDHKGVDVKSVITTVETKAPPDFSVHQLPSVPPPVRKRYAQLRYAIFTVYHRLFSIVFLGNLIGFITIMIRDQKLIGFVNAAAVNLLVSGLARNPLVVNVLFRYLCSLPRSAPLRLRRLAAKVFHYGGVHSGCGVASVVWYIGFIGLLSRDATARATAYRQLLSPAIITLAVLVLVLLLAIIIAAYPTFRFKRHDYFEFTHRFSSWLAIGLFWPLLILFAEKARIQQGISLGRSLVALPAFWILIFLTLTIVYPWLYLRKVEVIPEYISPHAVRLHFDFTTIGFAEGFAISKHPLRDWHSFAHFPDLDGKGFSCLVSKAGDWTSACIERPPTYVWKRGIPINNVVYGMRMFRSFIMVTTGSGIGPCLSYLALKDRPPMRVVWQTRSPLESYGQGILNCVAELDSSPIIIDTDRTGRQDMLPLILDMVKSFGAEAVVVVSNPVFTKRIVFELEARNVPAYGPIFDS